MNTEVQAQFDRVETALTALLESITSYNPSPSAAADLVIADDALSTSLTQLALHQSNHARLLSLRETSSNLDAQLKATLSLLAATRNELLSLPLTEPPPPDAHPVDYLELLNFAQRISRFTVPPTHRPPLPPPIPIKKEEGEEDAATMLLQARASAPPELPRLQTQEQLSLPHAPPLSGTAAPGTPNGPLFPSTTPTIASARLPSADPANTAATPAAGDSLANLALQADNPALQAWLSPPSHAMPFVPWPSEDRIRGGALGVIQGMLERGIDPGVVGNGEKVNEGGVDVKMEERGSGIPEVKLRRQSAVRSRVETNVPRVREMPSSTTATVFDDLDLYNPDEEG